MRDDRAAIPESETASLDRAHGQHLLDLAKLAAEGSVGDSALELLRKAHEAKSSAGEASRFPGDDAA